MAGFIRSVSIADGVTVLLAALALLVSILTAWRSERATRNGQSITVLLDLIGEFRTEKFVVARRRILNELTPATYDTSLGYENLPDDIKRDVVMVSHYLDHLGLLVAHRLVDADAVIGYIGTTIVNLWRSLVPYVEAERRRRKASFQYQEYFETLVLLIERRPQGAVIRRAKRWVQRRRRLR